MKPQLISFSITKDSIILEYSQDEKEIIAIIDPFLFCTYLVDLNVLADRKMIANDSMFVVSYLGGWIQWRMFVFDSQIDKIYTTELLEAIIERHIETELIKQAFHYAGNCNFSFN